MDSTKEMRNEEELSIVVLNEIKEELLENSNAFVLQDVFLYIWPYLCSYVLGF